MSNSMDLAFLIGEFCLYYEIHPNRVRKPGHATFPPAEILVCTAQSVDSSMISERMSIWGSQNREK